MNIAILLFEDFETLDVFGPVEIFGRLQELYSIEFYSQTGGSITNRHGVRILTEKLEGTPLTPEIFLVPGGIGTRHEVNNKELIRLIRKTSETSRYVLTVCTGSALLARTGLLDGRHATTNKRSFAWASGNGPHVLWNKTARWIVDGKYYTSSCVSAGMDMSLGFLADRHGVDFARRVASEIEYRWIED